MRLVLMLGTTSLFFYSLFWSINVISVLCILFGLSLSYLLYKIPERFYLSLKYPLILIHLGITAMFLVYPHLPYKNYIESPVAVIAFYSTLFYLVSLKEAQKSLYKEVLALSILFFSSFFNLLMINKPLLIVSMGLPIILFLFIIGHIKVIPFIGGYILIIVSILAFKNIAIIGSGFNFLTDTQRHILILSPMFLFIWSFVMFVKHTDITKIISFTVFLYVMMDIFITVGLKLTNSMLHQPFMSILMASPASGFLMKYRERGR